MHEGLEGALIGHDLEPRSPCSVVAPTATPPGANDMDAVRELWRTYGRLHQEELGEQDLDTEASTLPDGYEPTQGGGLWVTRDEQGRVTGIGALKRFDGTTVELKRMYVAPTARGTGAGRAIANAAVDAARTMGYQRVVLDTDPAMTAAHALYESLGFRFIPPYYDHSPCRNPVYMELQLR